MHDHPVSESGASGQAIGGFLTLETPVASPGGMAAIWQIDRALAWGNASSALSALVDHVRPGAVWLPGYLCATVLAAVPRGLRRYFPVSAAMTPDLASLAALKPGDLVLAVNYFGRSPGQDWRDFVAAHPHVTFVEDCAQALDTGEPGWGDWRLYSPRKVLGVPEGGLLVPLSARARGQEMQGPVLPPDPAVVVERMLPMLARLEAPGLNRLWHPLNQVAEASQIVSGRAMSRFALGLLASLDPAAALVARRANYVHLAEALPDLALLPESRPLHAPRHAPLGFPILLTAAQRDAVLSALNARSIFPAVHWRDIAAPAEFTSDHDRARRVATLPCDPHYGLQDMDRVVQELRKALQ